MEDEVILKRIEESFLTTNGRINEIIEIMLNQRSEISYLKGYVKTLGLHIEELKDQQLRLK